MYKPFAVLGRFAIVLLLFPAMAIATADASQDDSWTKAKHYFFSVSIFSDSDNDITQVSKDELIAAYHKPHHHLSFL